MMKEILGINQFETQSVVSTNPKLGLLVGLIIIDLIIIALNFYNSWIPDDQWIELFALGLDDSLGEYIQYFKWAVISVLFVFITIRHSSLSFLAWALLFLYLLLDDSLGFHENYGAYLMSGYNFDLPGGLRMQDIGELLVSAIAGSVLLLVFIWAYRQSDDFFKITTFNMFYLFLALVFFGVIFDVIAVMTYGGNATAAFFFDVFEEGGEMFVGSFMFWYAFLILDAKNFPISLVSSIKRLFSYKSNYELT